MMKHITFQDFACNFTRLCAADFKAASERYFKYRGMDGNQEMIEKHFIDFLHFLDLEDILHAFSASCLSGVSKSIDIKTQKSDRESARLEHHTQSKFKATSRVVCALSQT